MWCLVMFDLPVETKKQRREAARFRHDLLDWGFIMVQFSVYAKYWPTGGQDHAVLRAIKTHLPEGGQVRVIVHDGRGQGRGGVGPGTRLARAHAGWVSFRKDDWGRVSG